MASLYDIKEINEQFEDDDKPISLEGDFTGVHNEAQFRCTHGHEFYAIVRNVMNRKSTNINKYCPRCKDASKKTTRQLMATKFTVKGKPDNFAAWGKKRVTGITYHEADSKEALEQWCLVNEGSLPVWTRDNDQWDAWKIPVVISRNPGKIGTKFEWIAGRRTDKGDFEPYFYAETHQEVVNWATLRVFKDKEEFYTPVYMEIKLNCIVSLEELTGSK